MVTDSALELVAPHPLSDVATAGIVVVAGWRAPGGDAPSPRVLAALRLAHNEGAIVVGLCLGAFVLAEAGLLTGRRATTHWHLVNALELYDGVAVDRDVLYVDEGSVVTSAGSAAGIDACLHLIRRLDGAEVANRVARAMVVAPHRAGGQRQFVDVPVPAPRVGDGFAALLDRALASLQDPQLDVVQLAGWAAMSRRTFDRRFWAATGCSPLQWLTQQRVLRAQHLLEATDLSIDGVAQRVGFADGVSLRPHFRRIVGVAPAVYRASFTLA